MGDAGILQSIETISAIANNITVIGILLVLVYFLVRRSLSLEKLRESDRKEYESKEQILCKQHKEEISSLTRQVIQGLEISVSTMRQLTESIDDLTKNFDWRDIIAQEINNAINRK
jgi:hypothetical protein